MRGNYLQPTLEQAAKATEVQQDVHKLSTAFKRRDRALRKELQDANLVIGGGSRAAPPRVVTEPVVKAAIDGLLAEDRTPEGQRKVLGAHAKTALLKTYADDYERHGKPGRRKTDAEVGEHEWLSVYDAFAHTGIPAHIAEMTSLTVAQVEHLLKVGVLRLNLPPIRDHASRTGAVHSAMMVATNRPIEDHSRTDAVGDVSVPVEQAITTRAIRESAAAQQCLDAAIDANEIFSGFVQKMLEAVRKGAIEIGEPVRMSHLETLSKALNANTQALERAVKLSRLVRGETTDLVGAQIAVLLQACSTEELEEAEKRGTLPSRLLNRFAGGQQERGWGPLVIDVPPEDISALPKGNNGQAHTTTGRDDADLSGGAEAGANDGANDGVDCDHDEVDAGGDSNPDPDSDSDDPVAGPDSGS